MTEPAPPSPFRPRRAAAFVGIGLVLYALILTAAEIHVRRTGDVNPVHRIVTAEPAHHDWIILGASHAMPLDFAEFGARIEAETGQSVLNLAAPGTGPLYHRFVAQRYFAGSEADAVLVVIDSFGFYAERWNEGRFADRDLLARTPLDVTTLGLLARFVALGVDPRALLDYASGFSKINNHERFDPDRWEAEDNFDRAPRPSDYADSERIDYLFPDGADTAMRSRYMDELTALIGDIRAAGARVVAIKPPMPDRFRAGLPGEDAFDTALRATLDEAEVAFHDLSDALPEPRYYFDPDHLNRDGAQRFLDEHLAAILAGDGA